MTLEQVFKYFGSPAETARALGVTIQAVSAWQNKFGYVPEGRQWQIQAMTRGKLKAETPEKA